MYIVSNIQIPRTPRHIETVRARRKRYRNKKKLLGKAGWEQRIVDSLGERWKKRCEEYNKVEEEELLQGNDQPLEHESNEQYRQIKEKCQQEIASCQEELYRCVAENSMQKNSYDTLLLPSVNTPTALQTTYEGIDIHRLNFVSSIRLEQEKTRKALEKARFYRNLSERLRKEKRNVVDSMNDKVELVRDFWRNNIMEGSTRAGRMVKKALENRH